MKFSNNYLVYPDNNELIKALEHFRSLLSDSSEVNFSPENNVAITVKDNLLHTRGNFEQYRYNINLLDQARSTLEDHLKDTSAEEATSDWIALQISLGNILGGLAQQHGYAKLYEQAIDCFKSALTKVEQQDAPKLWATLQFNLGTAAQALGRLQNDKKLLKLAVDSYTDALLEWSREHDPQEWSATMFELGSTFHTHGTMLKGNRTLQKSVVAYKNALAELDADNHALGMVSAYNSRGSAFHHLGESEENSDRIEEAIKSYQTALTIAMEQQLPIHIATLCKINIATAHASIATLTSDLALADETADDFEIIIEAFHYSLQPITQEHCESYLKELRAQVSNG